MLKKCFLILLLFLLASRTVFSEDLPDKNFPKNKVVADVLFVLPALILLADDDLNTTFLSTGIQYERQITNKFSITGGIGYKIYFNYNNDYRDYDINYSAISAELGFRGYPKGAPFFAGGMIGYTYLSFNEKESVTAHFFTIGGTLGGRIQFGTPDGFILEPAFSYYIPYGKSNINNYFDNAVMKLLFAGGPRVSVSIGYRF